MPPQSKQRKYKGILVAFMSHKDGMQCTRDDAFNNQQLSAIMPQDIARYLKLKAHGDADADVETDHPAEGRANSLEVCKKAMSFCMPMRNATWNPMANIGNPAKSVDVNNLLKMVRKREARKEGKESQARRELEEGEFMQTNNMLSDGDGLKVRFMMPAVAKFQLHMVARVDDVAHFEEADLKHNPQFDFALLSRMGWSKNVLEEREAPDQTMLGAFNKAHCCLLGLAMFLEAWKEDGSGDDIKHLFGDKEDPERNKECMRDRWKDIWDSEDFVRLADGPLGGHSGRKHPAAHARRQGCDKDDIDSRGRWRKRRVQDRHVSPNLPCPDAKAASALCVGGPCKHELVTGSGVTQGWLRQVAVPCLIASPTFSNRVADVLALPLLWAAMSPDMAGRMPGTLRARIRAGHDQTRTLNDGANPVQKRLLMVSGRNAQVHIAVVPGPAGANAANQPFAQGMPAIHARLHAAEMGQTSLRDETNRNQAETLRAVNAVNRNVRRIAIQPGVRQQAANDQGAQGQARLSPTPRSLHALWQEHTVGIAGRKPARSFAAEERGKEKHKCHRRKVVWDTTDRLVRSGRTTQTAIDVTCQVHGHTSVTKTINTVRRDKARGGHPNLR